MHFVYVCKRLVFIIDYPQTTNPTSNKHGKWKKYSDDREYILTRGKVFASFSLKLIICALVVASLAGCLWLSEPYYFCCML